MKNILKIVFAAILCTTFNHQAFASSNQSVLAKHLIDKQDDDFKKFIKYNKKTDTLTLESYATKGKIAALGLTGLGCALFTGGFLYLTQKYALEYTGRPASEKNRVGLVILEQSLYLLLLIAQAVHASRSDSSYSPTTVYAPGCGHTYNYNNAENLAFATFWTSVLSAAGLAGTITSFLYAWKAYVKRTSHTPKLKLSPEGIYLNGVKVACWEDINDITSNGLNVTYVDQNARDLVNLSRNDSDLPMNYSDLILLVRHYIEEYGKDKFKAAVAVS